MAKVNVRNRVPQGRTYEGAPAAHINATQSLRRLVLSCLLWEDQFYIDGVSAADQIHAAADKVDITELAALAIEAREKFNLRHVPLWLLVKLVERGRGVALTGDTIARVLQRADEPGELVSLYWRGGKRPLSAQLKRGLRGALTKFDGYQLAKYDRDVAVKLRDVLFLSHAKPKDDEQAALFKSLADKTIATPDTWEVELSAGKDKGTTFTRLLTEGKLGYLALLRNLRNMSQANVDRDLVIQAILARKGARRVLPFRYTAAARAAPQYEPALDQALTEAVGEMPNFEGRTVVLVDVSGSMGMKLSAKGDMTRMDAAATLASVIPGDRRVFTFSERCVEVPARIGMAGVDAIINSQPHRNTLLGQALDFIYHNAPFDRLVVITDEQSHDTVHLPVFIGGRPAVGYMINVAAYQNGVGYGPWVRIDGFSEAVLNFMREHERSAA